MVCKNNPKNESHLINKTNHPNRFEVFIGGAPDSLMGHLTSIFIPQLLKTKSDLSWDFVLASSKMDA